MILYIEYHIPSPHPHSPPKKQKNNWRGGGGGGEGIRLLFSESLTKSTQSEGGGGGGLCNFWMGEMCVWLCAILDQWDVLLGNFAYRSCVLSLTNWVPPPLTVYVQEQVNFLGWNASLVLHLCFWDIRIFIFIVFNLVCILWVLLILLLHLVPLHVPLCVPFKYSPPPPPPTTSPPLLCGFFFLHSLFSVPFLFISHRQTLLTR